MCGEREPCLAGLRLHRGSSPRVRGTLQIAHGCIKFSRFIPACAGNARSYRPLCRAKPVHPRVCGERYLALAVGGAGFGSSPRVRGTLDSDFQAIGDNRFIPACAGNAVPWVPELPWVPVHPRVCGERLNSSRFGMTPSGSSPRVRGTRSVAGCRGPIYAVHPRVCGERPIPIPPRPGRPGSSPRVRGTRQHQRPNPGDLRFIPACAGNAACWACC